MILTFVITFILIFIEVGMNWWIIEKKKKSPNHRARASIRAGGAMILMMLSTQWDSTMVESIWKFVTEGLMFMFVFWWTFDTFLSLFRGRGWYGLDGEDPEEDSQVDKFEKGGPILWFWIKLSLAIIFSTLFVIA